MRLLLLLVLLVQLNAKDNHSMGIVVPYLPLSSHEMGEDRRIELESIQELIGYIEEDSWYLINNYRKKNKLSRISLRSHIEYPYKQKTFWLDHASAQSEEALEDFYQNLGPYNNNSLQKVYNANDIDCLIYGYFDKRSFDTLLQNAYRENTLVYILNMSCDSGKQYYNAKIPINIVEDREDGFEYDFDTLTNDIHKSMLDLYKAYLD